MIVINLLHRLAVSADLWLIAWHFFVWDNFAALCVKKISVFIASKNRYHPLVCHVQIFSANPGILFLKFSLPCPISRKHLKVFCNFISFLGWSILIFQDKYGCQTHF